MPFVAITKAKITDGRERRKEKPHAANNFLKAMRALFGWAVLNEHLKVDPTSGVTLLSTDTPDGFHTWTEGRGPSLRSEMANRHTRAAGLRSACYTGLRRGDAVRAGRPHVRNGILTIRTEKTGEVVVVPVLPPLRVSIDATSCGELTFLATL